MGACTFIDVARGKNAKDAFRGLVDHARYMNGHGGYTGTVAEKDSYVTIHPKRTIETRDDAIDYADQLIDEDDYRISDKWGPAGCIEVPDSEKDGIKEFIFFGWASS
jgi:hypothetical protein